MAIDDMASVRKQRKDICLKMDINYSAMHVSPNPINKMIHTANDLLIHIFFR